MMKPKREIYLTKEILETIDPMIRRLVLMINQLSFVKQTHYSCSGDYERGEQNAPYIIIEYSQDPQYNPIIKNFHKEIIANPNIIEIRKESYFESIFKLLKFQDLKIVHYELHLFELRNITSFNEFMQNTITKTYGKKPENILWPKKIDKENAIKIWQYFYKIVKKYLKNYSK